MGHLLFVLLFLGLCSTACSDPEALGPLGNASGPVYDAAYCRKIQDTFRAFRWDRSQCPSEAWLAHFHETDHLSPKVFINVGANKGYTLVHWLALWQQPLKLRCLSPTVPPVQFRMRRGFDAENNCDMKLSHPPPHFSLTGFSGGCFRPGLSMTVEAAQATDPPGPGGHGPGGGTRGEHLALRSWEVLSLHGRSGHRGGGGVIGPKFSPGIWPIKNFLWCQSVCAQNFLWRLWRL